ncbi:CAT RNA binding domain-containing protein [Thomasclavelia ramosa]
MKIKRIYNNNVVVSNDMSGKEIIIIGRGIAFQKKLEKKLIK